MSPADELEQLRAEVARLLAAGVRDEATAWLCAAAHLRLQRERAEARLRRVDGGPPWPRPREHDSERGYQQHRYDQTPACDPCRAAHALEHRRTA